MASEKKYPAYAVAYDKTDLQPLFSELKLVTFNSTTVFVPGEAVTFDDAPFAGNASLSTGVAPRAVISCDSSNGFAIRPILFGENGGATDPVGKSVVMSFVRVSRVVQRVGPGNKAMNPPLARIVRDWIGTVLFTGGSGTGNAYLVPQSIRLAVASQQADLETNIVYDNAVYASSASLLGGTLLPSGLVRVNQTEWAFDVGSGAEVEVYASCVNGVSGTPTQTVSGIAALWRPINL